MSRRGALPLLENPSPSPCQGEGDKGDRVHMDYQRAVDYIFSYMDYEVWPRIPHTAANYDLRRVEELLSRLGNPHLMARSVHIGGTNGKGSTAAMVASVLTASGYTTGLYTSPHLHTVRERIQVDSELISEEELAAVVTRLQPEVETVNQKATYGRLTAFELLTALAFAHFAGKGVNLQVLEVGLGGRFDATNVITLRFALLHPLALTIPRYWVILWLKSRLRRQV